MPGDPGIGFAFVLHSLLLIGAVAALAYLYVARSKESAPDDRLEEWHDEASSLAREVQEVADASPPIDRERVQRAVLPLSYRLEGHARDAPREVDEEVIRGLYELGAACYELGMEHRRLEATRTGVFFEDKLDDLRTGAEKLERAIQ